MKGFLCGVALCALPLTAFAADVSTWFTKAPAWPKTVDAAAACAKQLEPLNAQLEKEIMALAQQVPNYSAGAMPSTTSPAYMQATQLINGVMECRSQSMTAGVALQDGAARLEEKLAPTDAQRQQQLEKQCTRSSGEMSYIDQDCQKKIDAEYNGKASKIAEAWLAERGKAFDAAAGPIKACVAKGDAARNAGAKAGITSSTPFYAAIEPGSDLGQASVVLRALTEDCRAAGATKARYPGQT